MNRLKNIDGGMPLKLDDFDLIQDAYKYGFESILKGLLPEDTQFILFGISETIEDDEITISEGYLCVAGEIFYVPEATYTYDSDKIPYLEEDFTTDESRTFHDTTEHDVWDIRKYKIGYDEDPPVGCIRLIDIMTLRELLDQSIIAQIGGNSDLTGFYKLAYLTGFSKATAYDGIRLESNSYNAYMLLGAFDATVTAGKIATLPIGSRPTGDLVGYFFNGSVVPGILKIKSNGDIYVSGCRTSGGSNYISFQFFMRFEDPILFGLPTSGGGAPPEGDD